jgi:putative (di)nucleoside polyphosphate hydrolase
MATYRPNVAAILRDPSTGKIFIGERIDHRGSWQFPQGGVDRGEDLLSALYREVEEEIGVPKSLYSLVACNTDYRYKFPKGKLKKGKYCSQTQTYFLCDFHGRDEDINLKAHVQEFSRFVWIDPKDFNLMWVPRFKRPVFIRVFRDFFGIKQLPKVPKLPKAP